MNWKRGALRLWVATSVLWLVFITWNANLPLAISAFWKGYPAQQILDEEIKTRTKIDSRGNRCIEPPHHHPETADEFLGICTFYPEDVPPITRDDAVMVVWKFIIDGFAPPGGLLGLGFALVWIARGFRDI